MTYRTRLATHGQPTVRSMRAAVKSSQTIGGAELRSNLIDPEPSERPVT